MMWVVDHSQHCSDTDVVVNYPDSSVLWAASCGQRPVGQRPVGQRPVGQRPVGQRPVGQRPVPTDEGLEDDQHCTVQQQMSYPACNQVTTGRSGFPQRVNDRTTQNKVLRGFTRYSIGTRQELEQQSNQRHAWTCFATCADGTALDLLLEPELGYQLYLIQLRRTFDTRGARISCPRGVECSVCGGLRTGKTKQYPNKEETMNVRIVPLSLLLLWSVQRIRTSDGSAGAMHSDPNEGSALMDDKRPLQLEHPHTVPADGAVGVKVEGHQAFWTCDNKQLILVLTTVPPHTDSLGVSTKTKAGLVTEDDPLPF
ncbi:hypothetical protein NFI96_008623 [Prochilodus magdalenae]|nr:hypothetical protein NFI96_008623 [Prochilodus magdalenae]